MSVDIRGFIPEPQRLPGGGVYRGRLSLPGIQWTGVGEEAFATATLTANQLVDAIENRLIWTDQSVQRGIQPYAPRMVQRELPVAEGYPDPRHYIFSASNADEMTDKLLTGQQLFLNPLVWNLRPSSFSAYWSDEEEAIFLYSGKVYLPDSHHRHQAILKAVRAYRDHPSSFPNFDPERQFKVELYFLDRETEGDYFFDKNQRPKPTAQSKAFDLTTQDDLSLLAKRVLDKAPSFNAGVNRATDRLSKRAPHFVTLSTLREMMRTFAGSTEVDEQEMEGLAQVAAEFLQMLAEVRPELRAETLHAEREGSLASAAVMFHGYASLMSDYLLDIGNLGPDKARKVWEERLGKLAPEVRFERGDWAGDILSNENPVWEAIGLTKVNSDTGRISVSNTGGTRARAGRVLKSYLDGKLAEYIESQE